MERESEGGVGADSGQIPPDSGGGEQGFADLVEVGESEEQIEPGGVLGEAAVTGRRVSPEAFDDAEGKLDLGTEACRTTF
jgi:hypothetical protein